MVLLIYKYVFIQRFRILVQISSFARFIHYCVGVHYYIVFLIRLSPAVARVETLGSLIVRLLFSVGFCVYAMSILKFDPRVLHSRINCLSWKMLWDKSPSAMTVASKQSCHQFLAVLDTVLLILASALSEWSATRSLREKLWPCCRRLPRLLASGDRCCCT